MSGINGMFSGLDTSVSALKAERERMEIHLSNLANVNSTRTPEGGPYKKRMPVFEAMLKEAQAGASGASGDANFHGAGVQVAQVVTDNSAPIKVYRPEHPDADAQGFVAFPNISTAEEMVDLMSASRSFEANATAFKIAHGMYLRALELGRS